VRCGGLRRDGACLGVELDSCWAVVVDIAVDLMDDLIRLEALI